MKNDNSNPCGRDADYMRSIVTELSQGEKEFLTTLRRLGADNQTDVSLRTLARMLGRNTTEVKHLAASLQCKGIIMLGADAAFESSVRICLTAMGKSEIGRP